MSRGGEADQASFNARARSGSNAELLIAMPLPSIEAEPNAPEFATMWPFGNKYQSRSAGPGLLGLQIRRKKLRDLAEGLFGSARTRPKRRYPAWPRYSGSGAETDAASFRCVTE
jgi:hypothetical protein